jgi:hypothetical protein
MPTPSYVVTLVQTIDSDASAAVRSAAAIELAAEYTATGCEALHVVLTDARACRMFARSVMRERAMPVYTSSSK